MHDKALLINYMYSVVGSDVIPREEWDKFVPKISLLCLKKGDFLEKEGDVPQKIAFVTSGFIRYFCNRNCSYEVTIAFRGKGTFVSSYTSYLENRASKLSIQALEDSVLLYISIDDYMEFLSKSSSWQLFSYKHSMQIIIEKERREIEILSNNAETKYKKFLEEFPGLEDRIQHYYIASYLGISNVTLSRIRNKLRED